MHPIVHKVGLSFALCGILLLFACTPVQGQRIDPEVSPVDSSANLAGAGAIVQTNESTPSPKVTKLPPTFSDWSPQAVKQPAATTAWSRQASRPVANALSEDEGMSTHKSVKRPSTITTWGVQNHTKDIGPDSKFEIGNFKRGLQPSGGPPVQTRDDASVGPLDFHNPFSSTLSSLAGLSNPFDRTSVGGTDNLSSPTSSFSLYRYRATQEHHEARPRGSVPALRTDLSSAPKANPKP
jgi:hypothetical protein